MKLPHVPGFPRIPGQQLLQADGFTVLLQPRNLSKSNSVISGLELARSKYVICQDADLEYDPEDIPKLLQHAESTGAVAVFGSRLQGGRPSRRDSFWVGRVALSAFFRLLYRSRVTDVATCYKLLETHVARSLDLSESGFNLDFEVPAKLSRRGYAIHELPINYHPRSQRAGKKIRWRDGLAAGSVLLRLRLDDTAPETLSEPSRAVSLDARAPVGAVAEPHAHDQPSATLRHIGRTSESLHDLAG